MQKVLFYLFFLLFLLPASTLKAQSILSSKDGHKAMLTVVTYKEDGSLLGSGYGFFTTDEGEGVASYQLFKGASRAEVIDWKGNRLQVHRILGAAESCDLVRFSTVGGKKITAFTLGGAETLSPSAPLTLIRYSTEKKGAALETQVTSIEEFEPYKYLQITVPNEKANLTCPLLDTEGVVVAISQRNVTTDAQTACAIDARFVNTLTTNSTSALNSDLQSIRIPKALPANESDAMTYIYMMGFRDSLQSLTAYGDFIKAYPDNVEGYTGRAALRARLHLYAAAETDYETAFAKAALPNAGLRTDEVHLSWSKLIYQQCSAQAPGLPENWTYQRAYDEATLAQSEHPSPYARLQQAHCLFAMKEYARAYEDYLAVCNDSIKRNDEWTARTRTELWYSAARSLELSGGDSLQVIALMDSVVAQMERPYQVADARYLLERAGRLQRAGLNRRAISDYNDYEQTVGARNLNDRFYYIREQLELECKMYQQALDDIHTAMAINPQNPIYPVEQAYILLRAGLYKETIQACDDMIRMVKDNPDYYKFRGIAYGEMGKKREARESLLKAQELGDPTVEPLLERYK